MEYKKHLKKQARAWAANGYLSVYLCCQIFKRSDSCIRKWIQKGKLLKLKEGPEGSKAPVKIQLQSVLKYIDSFDED